MACIRKRRGKWVIDYYDQFGKRHWETCKNKKEAEQRLAKRLLEVANESYRPENRAKRFDEIAKEWFETIVVPNRHPNTIRQYKTHLEKHLIPYFGSIRLTRIDVKAIETYMAYKFREGIINKVTINKTIVTLGAILKYAVRHRYIDSNPVQNVEKYRRSPEKFEEKIHYLTPEQIRLLLDNSTDRYRILFMTAVLTGMREGELFGLKWSDIDWNANQVCVNRTFSRGRFYPPKTKASKRRIDLPPELVTELKKWRLRCPKSELDLVFPNSVGNPENHGNMLRRGFYPALRRAGLPRIRFHDLRHTYASLLIQQGEHPKYIQQQMGHSSIKVTMDTYGHLMEATNYEAAKRLGETIFGSKMVASGKNGFEKTLKNQVPGPRVELGTRGFSVRCSTA